MKSYKKIRQNTKTYKKIRMYKEWDALRGIPICRYG